MRQSDGSGPPCLRGSGDARREPAQMTETTDIAKEVRELARAATTAALATQSAAEPHWPYASLVTVACDLDASPILLLSDLAEHTKNIKAEPKVSLLFAAAATAGDPLAIGRVTVLGHALQTDEARLRERFLARHEEARGYAGFRDFHFYKLVPTRAHLVAGFGRIHWIEDFALPGDMQALAEAEADILAHMNADHVEAIRLYAEKLLGFAPQMQPWRMTGIDPEGCDLAADGRAARLPFEARVTDAEGARRELVRLVKRARGEI